MQKVPVETQNSITTDEWKRKNMNGSKNSYGRNKIRSVVAPSCSFSLIYLAPQSADTDTDTDTDTCCFSLKRIGAKNQAWLILNSHWLYMASQFGHNFMVTVQCALQLHSQSVFVVLPSFMVSTAKSASHTHRLVKVGLFL